MIESKCYWDCSFPWSRNLAPRTKPLSMKDREAIKDIGLKRRACMTNPRNALAI